MRNIPLPGRMFCLAMAFLFAAFAAAAPAYAKPALVIGNGAYVTVNELPSPTNDAAAVAESL